MKACVVQQSTVGAVVCLSLVLPVLPDAHAGCYSDACANQRSGATSSDLTLKYGGAYGQAAENYNNYRWGYGTGRNTNYHSPDYYPSPPAHEPITPEQQAELNRLDAQSEALLNQIKQTWGW